MECKFCGEETNKRVFCNKECQRFYHVKKRKIKVDDVGFSGRPVKYHKKHSLDKISKITGFSRPTLYKVLKGESVRKGTNSVLKHYLKKGV